MKKKSLFTRAGALLLSLTMLLPQVWAANAGQTKFQTYDSLADNLTYTNTITDHAILGREESHLLEVEPGGSVYPITFQGDVTIYGSGTINWAITQARKLGYNVIGAINSDFYSTRTGVPLGIVIEDGIYKSSPEDESAVVFTDGQAALLTQPDDGQTA